MSDKAKNHQPPTVVEGERIVLKARSKDQAAEMFSLIDSNRAHLKPWMSWESTTKTESDSLAYLELAQSWWKKGATFDYSIFEKSSSKMIGSTPKVGAAGVSASYSRLSL